MGPQSVCDATVLQMYITANLTEPIVPLESCLGLKKPGLVSQKNKTCQHGFCTCGRQSRTETKLMYGGCWRLILILVRLQCVVSTLAVRINLRGCNTFLLSPLQASHPQSVRLKPDHLFGIVIKTKVNTAFFTSTNKARITGLHVLKFK